MRYILSVLLLFVSFSAISQNENKRILPESVKNALRVLLIDEEEYFANIYVDESESESEDIVVTDEDDIDQEYLEEGERYMQACDSVYALYKQDPSKYINVTKYVYTVFGDIPQEYSESAFLLKYKIYAMPQEDVEEDEVYLMDVPIECEAEFPGGSDAFYKLLAKKIKLPKNESEGASGTVKVRFSVAKDGGITDIQIVSGISPGIDNAVVKAVEQMPKFTPATVNGKPVESTMLFPVRIRVN